MLDFRIETFLCVCRKMNFTRAAEELNLTQPAVSQHIKYLEEYYGQKLFDYDKRKLKLTPAGKALKNSMEALTHDVDIVREKIAKSSDKKYYHIGATRSIGGYVLPPKISKYIENNPDIAIDITDTDTKILMGLLDAGSIDVAFVEGYFDKQKYSHKLMRRENMIAVCSKDYEIGKVEKISDLFSHRLILREKGSGTREVFTRYLAEYGWSEEAFSSTLTVNAPHIINALLHEKMGISFVYHSVVEKSLADGELRQIEIPDFNLSHEFNAVWRSESLFASEYERLAEWFCRYDT